ncbi:hypothetical protein COV20_05935 [Candidatus Woesearchaeota archaeon CG10_big_fil_rev_8_21_14_0_10_45_16]|nr:MAG: hypothetical protein COV20_05935 [Candidatus Woesearchaeota archaeon CG10_big_fil_rev_8_21_14_0_10_45_16]
MDETVKLALDTIHKEKQAIIFAPSRASAEKAAEDIAKITSFSLLDLEKGVLKGVGTPTKQCRRLSHCIRKGVAFHHAGLTNKQKELIEDSFREGKIRIICATPTLAAGLSLPAYRVIIKSLKRYSGRWGMDWIPVLEYMQMAGRAGRPEYESLGEALTIAKTDAEKEEIHERYVCGVPEEIYSKLAVEPVLRTYLLSLIASGIIRDNKSMQDFFGKTFWAFQFGDMNKLNLIMERMLHLLEEWGFVTLQNPGGDFAPANALSAEQQMRATAIGKRVSELYLDPLTARHLLDCLIKYDDSKNTFSLLQMVSNTLEMRPLLRIKAKEEDFIHQELMKQYENLLTKEPSAFDIDYSDFMNSIKTALFFEAWIGENDEDYLLEKFNVRPGEIRVKLETADWLLYASEELAKVASQKNIMAPIHRLRLRLKDGVKEELLPLLKFKGIGRVRARKLYSNGLKDIGHLKAVDMATLSQLLGKVLAADVKEQLGETVQQVPAGKRKGQLSLEKF